VSLSHSPLTAVQQRSVLTVVKQHLLTKHGLRTLSPKDTGYKGRFEGPMFQRDGAYHNGTVWPWLMGAYVEALLRVQGADGAPEARRALAGLIEYLDARFPGQLPEVFDGDDTPERPQRARACIAQAWSVAEVLRGLALVIGVEGK
jgi:glycogen debranching enzyme